MKSDAKNGGRQRRTGLRPTTASYPLPLPLSYFESHLSLSSSHLPHILKVSISFIIPDLLANLKLVSAKMGYTDLDQLAINTIRLLAVCPLLPRLPRVLQVAIEGAIRLIRS